LPYVMPETPALGVDYWLELDFVLKAATFWAEVGHSVAWGQFALPCKTPARPRPVEAMPKVRVEECARRVHVGGPDFEICFDRVFGRIQFWKWHGMDLLRTGPRLGFWRAPTDNDRGLWCGNALDKKARAARLHQMQHRIDAVCVKRKSPGAVRVYVKSRVAPPVLDWGIACEYIYTIYGSGEILLDVAGAPEGKFTFLPRVGLDMALPAEYDRVAWYGRGPGECYSDTKQAGRFGLYCSDVASLETPYVFPQENGNRTDVHWVAFGTMRGAGLMAQGSPTLNFSARWHTINDLENAKHTIDLPKRDFVSVQLDWKHHGIGTASCGPETLPEYELRSEPFRFEYRLAPFSVDDVAPCVLARRGPEVL